MNVDQFFIARLQFIPYNPETFVYKFQSITINLVGFTVQRSPVSTWRKEVGEKPLYQK